jgi:hypothetical protein
MNRLARILCFVAAIEPKASLNSNLPVLRNILSRGGSKNSAAFQATVSNSKVCTSDSLRSSSKQDTILEWVRLNGGYVNPKIELSTGPDKSWVIPGIFSTGPIPKGEKLLVIPPKLMFRNDSLCHIICKFRDELNLREKSFWWPYLCFLEEIDPNIPAFWTGEERELLSALSPINWTRPVEWYKSTCCRNNDTIPSPYLRALELVVSRCNIVRHNRSGLMFYLTPLYDFLNHGSIVQMNTLSLWDDEEGCATISTSKDIQTGEQLWSNYGYEDVDSLFSLYGFLPQYPRLWIFDSENNSEQSKIIFRMHEEKGGNYSFDFNPYNSYPIIRMGYMRSKIQNHLTAVQAKLNNIKLLRLQGIKDDPNKNKSFRLKKFVISHTYQKEYIKALEEALHYMDRISSHYRPFFVSSYFSNLSATSSATKN